MTLDNLSRRIQKLELIQPAFSENPIHAVERRALEKLSSSDAALALECYPSRSAACTWSAAHHLAWKRFDEALVVASEELGLADTFRAADFALL